MRCNFFKAFVKSRFPVRCELLAKPIVDLKKTGSRRRRSRQYELKSPSLLLPAPASRSYPFIPQLSLLLTILSALLVSASSCVKLPRHSLQASGQTAPPISQVEASHLININTASSEELEKLPGIGKALAARIVSFREQYGRFRRAEYLMMVRGISDRRFRAMRALITAE